MVTAQTAPTPEPRPALDADDPRVARYRADYEERMAQVNAQEANNTDAQLVAREAAEKAQAAFEVAQEEFNAAQDKLATARAEQLRAADAYAKLGNPVFLQPTPAEIMSPGEDTVLMVFPTNVTVQANTPRADGVINGTRSATFPEGIQEVPVSLQNHPYLIAHNVRPYGGEKIERRAPRTRVKADETKAA